LDVKPIPLNGCLMLVLGICTLGIAPLGIKLKERSWPMLLDEEGLVTRGGNRIAWDEFTKIEKVVTRVQGTWVERYDLHSPKGKVSVVVYRLQDGPEILEMIWQRLPDKIK
jgi:hypothetical protein